MESNENVERNKRKTVLDYMTNHIVYIEYSLNIIWWEMKGHKLL